jgi:hypothetical protein
MIRICVLVSKEIHNMESLENSKNDLNYGTQKMLYTETFKNKIKPHLFKLRDEEALNSKILSSTTGVKDVEKFIDVMSQLFFNGKG